MEMKECRWCGMTHGLLCPAIKAIEYHSDGAVKRVEFKVASDFMGVTTADPIPINLGQASRMMGTLLTYYPLMAAEGG